MQFLFTSCIVNAIEIEKRHMKCNLIVYVSAQHGRSTFSVEQFPFSVFEFIETCRITKEFRIWALCHPDTFYWLAFDFSRELIFFTSGCPRTAAFCVCACNFVSIRKAALFAMGLKTYWTDTIIFVWLQAIFKRSRLKITSDILCFWLPLSRSTPYSKP